MSQSVEGTFTATSGYAVTLLGVTYKFTDDMDVADIGLTWVGEVILLSSLTFASALSSAIMSWNRPSKTPSTLSRKVAAFPVLEFMSPVIPRFVA
jgi:hypothetical protein